MIDSSFGYEFSIVHDMVFYALFSSGFILIVANMYYDLRS